MGGPTPQSALRREYVRVAFRRLARKEVIPALMRVTAILRPVVGTVWYEPEVPRIYIGHSGKPIWVCVWVTPAGYVRFRCGPTVLRLALEDLTEEGIFRLAISTLTEQGRLP